jgi:GNAT superfamily N-acetyltransferase
MASERTQYPIQVDFALADDVSQVIAVMDEAAAWMSAKGTPAWDLSVLGEAFLASLIARSELLVARCDAAIVGVCTLARDDPEFWPEAPVGLAAYLHKLAVRRTYAGGLVTPSLIERCGDIARDWDCSMLRLDCHPNLRGVYEGLGFSYVDRYNPRGDMTFVVDRLQMRL